MDKRDKKRNVVEIVVRLSNSEGTKFCLFVFVESQETYRRVLAINKLKIDARFITEIHLCDACRHHFWIIIQ
jgi:EAL domain-containing protein (putative c-di-GMP-specific phosphodiesterase class I)